MDRTRAAVPGAAGRGRSARLCGRRGDHPPVDRDDPGHRARRARDAPGLRLRAAPLPHGAQHRRHPGRDATGHHRRPDRLGAAHPAHRGRRHARTGPRPGVDRDRLRAPRRPPPRQPRLPLLPAVIWRTGMTLIGPVLDDRTFEQLRAELLGRIPVYAPEWTNHNDSDPGIALLDLFAFLGESLLYRFNQIPDATRTAFLRLLDLAPNPPRPAQVLATVSTERPEGVQLLARTGLQAGAVAFETDGELYAWPLEALGAGKVAAPAGTDPAELGRRCDAVVRLGLTSA